jgi:hypothetical protein
VTITVASLGIWSSWPRSSVAHAGPKLPSAASSTSAAGLAGSTCALAAFLACSRLRLRFSSCLRLARSFFAIGAIYHIRAAREGLRNPFTNVFPAPSSGHLDILCYPPGMARPSRPTVAILDDQLPIRLQAKPRELDDVDVLWTGQSVQALVTALPELRPQVLVLQLEHLGPDPIAKAQELTALAHAELTLVTYAFARRELLEGLQREALRPLRAPLTVTALRTQMTHMIARSLMESGDPQAQAVIGEIRPPRFSPSQLAKLESIPSIVKCECPQHLSTILSSLVYFEAYCKECENRSDDDAEVHRMLHERTARARMLLEDGLERLLEHEDLRV